MMTKKATRWLHVPARRSGMQDTTPGLLDGVQSAPFFTAGAEGL